MPLTFSRLIPPDNNTSTLYGPVDILVYNGVVYVADYGGILVYDLTGNLLRQWNVAGLTGIAIAGGLIFAATETYVNVYDLYGNQYTGNGYDFSSYGATAIILYDHYVVTCASGYYSGVRIEDRNGQEPFEIAYFESAAGYSNEQPVAFVKLKDPTNPSTGVTNTGIFVLTSAGRLRELVRTGSQEWHGGYYTDEITWHVSASSVLLNGTSFTTPPKRMVKYGNKLYAPDTGESSIRIFDANGAQIENSPLGDNDTHAIAAYNSELYLGDAPSIRILSIDNTQITIYPTSATVEAGNTEQFQGVVTGTTNTEVDYYLDEGSAGGRVDDSTAVYYPPNTPGTFHVVARSVADRTVEARATVTVPNPAIRFRAMSTMSADMGGNTFSVSKPSGTLINDLLIAKVVCLGEVTPPAGWQHIIDAGILTAGGVEATFGTGQVVQYFYKIATENEPSEYTFQKSVDFNVSARIYNYFGVNVANPVAQALKQVGAAPADGEILAPDVTTESDLAAVIYDFNCIGTNQAADLDINNTTPLHLTKRSCAVDPYSLVSDLWTDRAVLTPTALTDVKLTMSVNAYDVAVAIVLNPTEPGVTVTPSTASIFTSETQQFQAIVTGLSNSAVEWSATGGTIDADGLYTAPSSPGTYTVTATSVSDPTKQGTATVTVTTPVPTITISPKTATVRSGDSKAFSATTAHITNGQILWSVQEVGGGSITQDGGYVAPEVVGTYHVVATLFEQGGVVPVASDSATVTVVQNTGITVSVTPPTATVAAGEATQINASVRDAQGQPLANQGVTWAVVEADGGTVDSTGRYTAPAKKSGIFHVTATSVVDTSASATCTITVTYTPVTITVTPNPVLMGAGQQQQFTANVQGTIYTNVVWSVREGTVGGTITQTGLYTSPEVAGVYHVRATLASDATVYGEATVTATVEKNLYTETTIIGMSVIDSDGLAGVPLYAEFTVISNAEAKDAISNALDDACIWVAGIAAYSGVDIQSPIIAEEGWYTGENYQKETDYNTPGIDIPVEDAFYLAFFTISAEAGDNAKYEFLWKGPEGHTERLAYFYDEDKKDEQNNNYTLFHGIYMADRALTTALTDESVSAHSIDFDQEEPEEDGGGTGDDEEEQESGHLNACYVSAEIVALRPAIFMGGNASGTARMAATMGTPVTMPGGTAAGSSRLQAQPFGFPKALEGAAAGITSLRATLGTPLALSGTAAGQSGMNALFGFDQDLPGGAAAGTTQMAGGNIVTVRPLPAGKAAGVTYISSANMTLVSDQTITITLTWKRRGIKNA